MKKKAIQQTYYGHGGTGKECSMFHKHVAKGIAVKTEDCYEKILSIIRVKLSFLILRSS